MGLLDDAIREHLELKRKHGADPTEVARQEREALGSGRVPPQPADPDAAAEAEPLAEGGGLAVEDAPDLPDLPASPVADLPPVEDLPPLGPPDEPEIDWSDPAPVDEPAPQPAADGEEDVLEETPEFLQETPEHDRLWFEQRPPKDFDF